MKVKGILTMLLVGIAMTTGVIAGDFKIQYPADTDLFVVETTDGNTTITNAIISTLFDASSATVYFADDAISEADISFATSCGTGNHLYIDGTNLACEADQVGGMDYTNIGMLNETGQIFIGTQIFDVLQAQDWTNASITESQISDFGTYLTSQQGNDTFIISVDMDDLAELNTQISGDLISSAQMNASFINLVKGTMTDGQWCLYESATDSLICNTAPVVDTDTHMGYDNIAMLNESGTFTGDMSFTALLDKGNFTVCGDNEILKVDTDTWVCEADATGTGGVADYTNIALTNKTNIFAEDQYFSKNITIADRINGTGSSDSYMRFDATGNIVFVLGA